MDPVGAAQSQNRFSFPIHVNSGLVVLPWHESFVRQPRRETIAPDHHPRCAPRSHSQVYLRHLNPMTTRTPFMKCWKLVERELSRRKCLPIVSRQSPGR